MEHVAAVVVAYNPENSLVALCSALAGQGCGVHVVDNSATPGTVVNRCSALGAVVHSLGTNLGVGGALATGLDALPAGTEWVLTFDQDSVVPDGYVAGLLGSAALTRPEVAVVGPVARDRQTGVLIQGDRSQHSWYPVPRLITSGALCRVSALQAVNGFRRELFIDYVDFDLCARLRRAGYVVAVEPSVELAHSIGHLTRHALPDGFAVSTTNHGRDRQYYKYRNFILLIRDGTFRQEGLTWKARSALALAFAPVKILALESDRRGKLSGVWRGVVDGLASRTGPRPSARARHR